MKPFFLEGTRITKFHIVNNFSLLYTTFLPNTVKSVYLFRGKKRFKFHLGHSDLQ